MGADQSPNFLVWLKLFFEFQMKRYKADVNVLLQNNTSAIRPEWHGKSARTKRTRHLAVRYYYCSLPLNNGTIFYVQYCATKLMISDFMTKPLQGSLFWKHRNTILGIGENEEAYHHRIYHERNKGLKQGPLIICFIISLFFLVRRF